MNLNTLCTSSANPKLLAYAAIFSIHDFNRCPLAPPGTKVIVHEKTDNRRSWSPYVMYDWYIDPSMKNYGYVQCFMPTTSSLHNVYTLAFFPAAIPFPKTETEYYLQLSVGDISAILSKPITQLPLLTYGDTTTSPVESIASLL